MSRRALLATTFAIGCTFAPLSVSAAETSAAPTTPVAPAAAPAVAPSEVAKDTWLDQMLPMLPELICKGFLADDNLKKRFNELKITYEQCVTSIPAISTKCKAQVYDKIPKMINNESAATWGRSIGECIGKNYAEQYLVPKH